VIRDAVRSDLPRIIELFANANDAPYDLRVVAEEKCFGAGVSGEPAVRVHGEFAGVSVTCGKYLRIIAVDRSQRRRGIGSALLRDAEARGVRIIAAAAGNYFTPGVVASDVTTIEFFMHRGYRQVAETQNLETTNLPSEFPADVFRATNRDRVLAFIEKEFGRIWRFEAAKGGENLFCAEANGEIVGFSAHDANNRGLGFFGPTGVARAQRGRGIGARLLQASLADLRRIGYERAVIPWTDAIDFYRKVCGAEVAGHFVTLARDT